MNNQPSDKDLIIDCLAKKGLAFKSYQILVERYESIVYKTAFRYLGDVAQAEEITQEAFLSAYSSLHTLENHDNFKGWILRIARNHSVSVLRLRKKEIEYRRTLPSEEVGMDFSRDEHQKLEQLVEALGQLEPEDGEILEFYYMCEMSVKELVVHYDSGESAIKMRLSRARNKLQKMMAEMDTKG